MFTISAECNGDPFELYRKLKIYLELKVYICAIYIHKVNF